MTIEQFIEQGRLNAKMQAYRTKKTKAIDVCVEQLKAHECPYVAISGGKDSVAMAFIVDAAARQIRADFTLWAHISDASFPGTLEVCQQVAQMLGRRLDIYQPDFSAFDKLDEKQRMAFGKTGVFFSSVKDYNADKDLAFVGVRAYESARRMKAAKAHGMVFHSNSMGGIDIVNPLQWFRLNDVASVLYEYDAPIHPIYYKTCINTGLNANKEPHFIRLGYITSRDLLDKGTAVFMKMNYPDIYNRLMERFPEIRNFVRITDRQALHS